MDFSELCLAGFMRFEDTGVLDHENPGFKDLGFEDLVPPIAR
jgi:hypothetical protein